MKLSLSGQCGIYYYYIRSTTNRFIKSSKQQERLNTESLEDDIVKTCASTTCLVTSLSLLVLKKYGPTRTDLDKTRPLVVVKRSRRGLYEANLKCISQSADRFSPAPGIPACCTPVATLEHHNYHVTCISN